MVHAKHRGKHSKTRYKRTKTARQKGMAPITVHLQEFALGQRVHINVDPSVHSGVPHRRFYGKTGVVAGKQGRCYLVRITDMHATKEIIVHPAHLRA